MKIEGIKWISQQKRTCKNGSDSGVRGVPAPPPSEMMLVSEPTPCSRLSVSELTRLSAARSRCRPPQGTTHRASYGVVMPAGTGQ
ncbi:hypothetical protein J6590_065394 [Homalodisca vitripennis]|nr:hypothetical protein J6590_065394 [Homalodisca vitripennis]